MSTQPGEIQFGPLKSLLFSVILILGFFTLAEVLVRAYVYAYREPEERYDLRAGTFVLVPGTYRRGNAQNGYVNSRGFVGREFEDPPPAGTIRIIAVGDSCTFGNG